MQQDYVTHDPSHAPTTLQEMGLLQVLRKKNKFFKALGTIFLHLCRLYIGLCSISHG